MMYELNTVRTLYRKLLTFYPRTFREELGESMDRTFQDLWHEKRHTKKELFGFVVWTFIETTIGIFREHLRLISPGDIMQTMLKPLGLPALLSLLIILPFMIMEVVNRRNFNDGFPFMLFYLLWFNLFALSLILLPIVRGRRTANHDVTHPVPTQGNARLANPRSAALISVVLFLSPGILPLLDSIGLLSTDRLFNGPNPEVTYLPGLVIFLGLLLFPVAAGIVASRPIVNTLRAGGSLFAYPIHLILVLVISFLFATGVIGMIVDQWPCFIGVPNCD
jgi:hypothetical protein